MNRGCVAIGMLILLGLLAGCGDQRILERTGFIQTLSYDLASNRKIKVAISVPISNPDIKNSRQVMETVAKSSKEARINLSRQTDLYLVNGQLRTTLFGLPLAKNGLWSYLDSLIRDPNISEKVQFIIVNGDAGSLIHKNYKAFPLTGKYIDRLTKKEIRSNKIPETTIYSFVRDYRDDGIDPIAPMIKDNGDTITIDGIGIFHDDKYVGRIDSKNSIILSFLRGSLKHGEISLDLSQSGSTVMLSSLNSTRKVKISQEENEPIHIVINVEVMGSVLEYIGELKLSEDADRHKLEAELGSITSQQAKQITTYIQQKKADSLGIGTSVRNSMSYKAWKELNWTEKYPTIKIECNIAFKIKDYGFRE